MMRAARLAWLAFVLPGLAFVAAAGAEELPWDAEILRFTLPVSRAGEDGCTASPVPLDSVSLIELWRYDSQITIERSRPPVAGPGEEETLLVLPGAGQTSYGVTLRAPGTRRSCMSNLVTCNGRVGAEPAGEVVPGPWLGIPRPNPVRGLMAIPVGLAAPGELSLDVLDIAGRLVVRLARGPRAAGVHIALWDARGSAPGVYLVRARVRGWQATQRVLVLR